MQKAKARQVHSSRNATRKPAGNMLGLDLHEAKLLISALSLPVGVYPADLPLPDIRACKRLPTLAALAQISGVQWLAIFPCANPTNRGSAHPLETRKLPAKSDFLTPEGWLVPAKLRL